MRRPRLLLVLPSHYDANGRLLTAKKAAANVNLNLPVLAGLTPADWDVRIVNDYLSPLTGAEPDDLIGITTLTSAAPRAYELADKFRARGAKVVLGGCHVAACPDEAAAHADALLIGEAEDVWAALLDDFQRDELKDRYQPAAWPDLAGRPTPRYDLVDKRDYQIEIYPVEAGRGCPNGCDYCAVTGFHGARRRLRPVGEVVRDIRATKSRFLAFVDDNIAAEPDYARELFAALAKLDVRWLAAGSMALADDAALLAAAVRGGLRFYWVGVESLDAATLAEVHRPINQIGDFGRRLEALRRHGLLVGANFIFGFDTDTPETYERVAAFVAETRVFPFLYMLTPMPGTKLFARMEAAGRIVNRDWSRYSGFETVYQPLHGAPAEQNERYFALAERLFGWRANLQRLRTGLTLRHFPDGLFTHLGGFFLAGKVGASARKRVPDYG